MDILKDYVVKSMAERDLYYVDERALCLHATFNGSMQEVITIAESVYSDFVIAFEPKGMFDCLTDCRHRIKVNHLLDAFKSELVENGVSLFITDFYLRTDHIKTKTDVMKRQDALIASGGCSRYENKVWKQRIKNAKAWARKFERQERDKRKIEALLHCKTYLPSSYQGVSDARCSFECRTYGNAENTFMAVLSFRISLYSLGDNVNDAAEVMKAWLKKTAEKYTCVTGYVCTGPFYGFFDSPQMSYFNRVSGGIILDANGNLFECKEWITSHYTDGIEWANVLSKKVVDKIKGIEDLRENERIEFCELKNGGVILAFCKNLDGFSSLDIDPIYSNIKDCLCPGSSSYEIDALKYNIFDLPIYPDNYEVREGEVFFSRGDFDFITDTWEAYCDDKYDR